MYVIRNKVTGNIITHNFEPLKFQSKAEARDFILHQIGGLFATYTIFEQED